MVGEESALGAGGRGACGARVDRRQAGTNGGPGLTPSPSIIVVEDDIDQQDMLRVTLLRAGYRVETYSDARKALSALEAGLPADLVLLPT